MTDLRNKFAEEGSQLGGVHIYPNYDTNSHLFNFLLTIEKHLSVIRIQHDNLYVRSYFIHKSNKLMEFKYDQQYHMVDPNSEFLCFGDIYMVMEGTGTRY